MKSTHNTGVIIHPKMTRLLLITVTLLLFFVGACQTETPAPDTDSLYGELEALNPNDASVVYWHTLTGANEDQLLTLIDEFNAKNEWGITAIGEYQGDSDSLQRRIIAGASAGQLPSLIMTDSGQAATYAEHGIGLDLMPYVESENWGYSRTELADFFPGALDSERPVQARDQLLSFPTCRSLQVLYFNNDWLKELGVDGPPQTWNEFREIACSASRPADGLHGFALGMDSSVYTSLLATQDISLVDPNTTTFTLGGEQALSVLQFIQDLVTDGCALWEIDEGNLISDFVTGKILFAIDSTDRLSAYDQAIATGANFGWSFSTLPHTTDEPLLNVRGASMTILQTSPKEQLAAWLFIKWMTAPTQQARWAQHMACFPNRRSALEEMETYLEQDELYRLASQLLENAWIMDPHIAAFANCRSEIGRMLYAVTAGESINQWLDDTRSNCNQALSDALK